VTICHRTGSATNPYVQITISRNALDAHLRHGDPAPTGGPCPGATAAHERPRGGNDKVTICHRTGSATNPYVVITIARAGWENGHSKHEGDRLLGPGDDPARLCVAQGAQGAAATPSTSSGCPTTTTVEVLVGVWHATGSTKKPFVFITPSLSSAHYDRSKHPDDRIVTETRVVSTGATTCASAASLTTTTAGGGSAPPPAGAAAPPAAGEPAPQRALQPGSPPAAGAVLGASAETDRGGEGAVLSASADRSGSRYCSGRGSC
jgi:hypothetical protein